MQCIINHLNVLDYFHMGVCLFIHGKEFIHSFEDKIILGRFVVEARVKLARPNFVPSKTPMKESVYRRLQQGTPNYHQHCTKLIQDIEHRPLWHILQSKSKSVPSKSSSPKVVQTSPSLESREFGYVLTLKLPQLQSDVVVIPKFSLSKDYSRKTSRDSTVLKRSNSFESSGSEELLDHLQRTRMNLRINSHSLVRLLLVACRRSLIVP
jgi:hypothetical protein